MKHEVQTHDVTANAVRQENTQSSSVLDAATLHELRPSSRMHSATEPTELESGQSVIMGPRCRRRAYCRCVSKRCSKVLRWFRGEQRLGMMFICCQRGVDMRLRHGRFRWLQSQACGGMADLSPGMAKMKLSTRPLRVPEARLLPPWPLRCSLRTTGCTYNIRLRTTTCLPSCPSRGR